MLNRRHIVTEIEARFFMAQLLDGVDYLHTNRVIHRDLKPDNLLLSEGLQLKIADFGLAVQLPMNIKTVSKICGTPNFTAPEVIRGLPYEFPVDVWAVGCIYYNMLVGRPPFYSPTTHRVKWNVTKGHFHMPPDIDVKAMLIIKECLQHNHKCRPPIIRLKRHSYLRKEDLPKVLPVTSLTETPNLAD